MLEETSHSKAIEEATKALYILNSDMTILDQCYARQDYERMHRWIDKHIAELESDKAALESRTEELEAEKDKLATEKEQLLSKNDMLETEIERLRDILASNSISDAK
jgi:chromosome segregation ATPase